MNKVWWLVIVSLCLSPVSYGASGSATGSFGYDEGMVSDPYPGLGTEYCSLAKGLETVLWNPAGLIKNEKPWDIVLDYGLNEPSTSFNDKTYKIKDQAFNMGGSSLFQGGMFYTDDTTDCNLSNLKERTITSVTDYKGQAAAIDRIGVAGKLGNFVLGCTSLRDTKFGIDVTGTEPAIYQMNLDFKGFTGSGFTIGSDGKANFTYTPAGGSQYTVSTGSSLWSDFLAQNKNVPLTSSMTTQNSLTSKNGLIISGATKVGQVMIGVNMVPIEVSTVINNTADVTIASGATDVTFYQPKFNPGSQSDATTWATTTGQYDGSAGYKTTTVDIPDVGTKIMDMKYSGNYSGSAVRWDLGFLYDLGPNSTVGLNFENVNGAVLNMTGSGVATYGYTKIDTNVTAPDITPNGTVIWNPFLANYATMQGTENWYLPSVLKVELPRSIKLGITFKKPVILALDYEKDLHKAQGSAGGEISDMSFVRLGLEGRILMLPVGWRLGLGGMFKPSVSGNADLAKTVEDAYSAFFILPTSLDLGLNARSWGTEVGLAVRCAATPALRAAAAQIDNLTEMVRYEIYGMRDNFKLSLVTAGEAFMTGYKLTNSTGSAGSVDLTWTSVMSVAYAF